MCEISKVAGAAGSAPPMKMAATSVAGASGMPPTKVAGDSGTGVKGATGGGDASAGAGALGGGAPGSLASVLESLSTAVKALAEAVSKMQVSGGGMAGCGGKAAVAGVQGGEATKQEFVARTATTRASGNREDDPFEQQVLELINQERSKHGLAPVTYNGALDNAAEKHAHHMSIVGRMAHDGIGDGTPGERIRAEGFRKAWGENVATGQTSAAQVVREWMNSPTHRRNILDPNFRQMGVGLTTASNGRTYWAQEFGS